MVYSTFGEDECEHRIANYKAKWDEENRKLKKSRNVFAKGLSAEVTAQIAHVCTTAFHALGLQDYGRVDLRLTHDDAVYVLEVNPNPFLAQENEMADAAAKAGLSYPAFIQRIVDEALRRARAVARRAGPRVAVPRRRGLARARLCALLGAGPASGAACPPKAHRRPQFAQCAQKGSSSAAQ